MKTEKWIQIAPRTIRTTATDSQPARVFTAVAQRECTRGGESPRIEVRSAAGEISWRYLHMNMWF